MDTGNAGGLFVVGDVEELVVIDNHRHHGEEAEHRGDRHVHGGHGEHGAEEVGVGVGVQVAGADEGDGNAYGNGKHNGQDEVRVFFEILTEKFDGKSCQGGESKGYQHRAFPEEEAQGDAGQGRMGQGVANHGVPFQHDENADAGAEDGDADGNEKGILHEIITEHGRPPFLYILQYNGIRCRDGPCRRPHGRGRWIPSPLPPYYAPPPAR